MTRQLYKVTKKEQFCCSSCGALNEVEIESDFFTQFSLWLRKNRRLCSSLGYNTNNLDYIWENFKTEEWILIEEKRCFNNPKLINLPCNMKRSQRLQFERVYTKIFDDKFKGFFVFVFENTDPEDGKIWIYEVGTTLKVEITKEELIHFLKFKISFQELRKRYLQRRLNKLFNSTCEGESNGDNNHQNRREEGLRL